MPRVDTPSAALAWIEGRQLQVKLAYYRRDGAGPIIDLFWNAPLGRYRPCGCPCDVAVFGHTRCPLAAA